MKKITILLTVMLTLSTAANSFAAFAWLSSADPPASTQIYTATAPNPDLTLKPSANVYIGYDAGANGVSYTLGSYHKSGTFTYCTSSTDTNIFRFNTTGGNGTQANVQECPDAPATATTEINWDNAAGVAWTATK